MSRVRCDFNREMNCDWDVRATSRLLCSKAAPTWSSPGAAATTGSTSKDGLTECKSRRSSRWPIPTGQFPLSGRLKAKGDLWANSNTDFFDTSAGTVSFEVSDGVLHKFTLLSRILGLMHLEDLGSQPRS